MFNEKLNILSFYIILIVLMMTLKQELLSKINQVRDAIPEDDHHDHLWELLIDLRLMIENA